MITFISSIIARETARTTKVHDTSGISANIKTVDTAVSFLEKTAEVSGVFKKAINGEYFAPQNGHVCKISALAHLDKIYADRYGIPNIPLRKNHRALYEERRNVYGQGLDTTSVRHIAKSLGSVQGEVLERDTFANIAQELGYQVREEHPKDQMEMSALLLDCFAKDQPVITFCAVHRNMDRKSLNGQPKKFPTVKPDDVSPRTERGEHAYLLFHINQTEPDDGYISTIRAGFDYKVKLSDLYASMQTLRAQRSPESYKKQVEWDKKNPKCKYENVTKSPNSFNKKLINEILLTTHRPAKGSGFRNTVFICTPDFNHPRWKDAKKPSF